MYIAVVLTAALIVILYLLIRYFLGARLGYGIAGLFLLILPHAIGIYRPFDSGTFTITLVLSVVGALLLVADVARQKRS